MQRSLSIAFLSLPYDQLQAPVVIHHDPHSISINTGLVLYPCTGRDCSVETLDDSQKRILKDLLLFGIVYQRKENSRRFYPTTLAVQLLSGSTGGGFSPLELGIGCLILETNFRLYAYTKSPLWPQVVPPALQLPPYARSHPLSYPNPIHH
mgnify:CR=1 FL=1